jgi:hypothetical protein
VQDAEPLSSLPDSRNPIQLRLIHKREHMTYLRTIAFGVALLSAGQISQAQVDESVGSAPIKNDLAQASDHRVVEIEQELNEPAGVIVFVLQHADASIIELALNKLFDAEVRSGKLAVVADTRLNRVILRASDNLFSRVSEFIKNIDQPDERPNRENRESKLAPDSSDPSVAGLDSKAFKQGRAAVRIEDYHLSGDVLKNKRSLLQKVVSDVENEFEETQLQLKKELATLRSRLASLEEVLEQRQVNKTPICRERVQSILSSLSSGTVSNDPLVKPENPSDSGSIVEGSSLPKPNNSLSVQDAPQNVSAVIVGEVIGDDNVKLTAEGMASINNLGSVHFTVDNQRKSIRIEANGAGFNPIAADIQMECQSAPQSFWERIRGKVVTIQVTHDVFKQVESNGLFHQVLYLPNDRDSIVTLAVPQLNAGVDPIERAKSIGQPILSVRFSSNVSPAVRGTVR